MDLSLSEIDIEYDYEKIQQEFKIENQYIYKTEKCEICGAEINVKQKTKIKTMDYVNWYNTVINKQLNNIKEPEIKYEIIEKPIWEYEECHNCKNERYIRTELKESGVPNDYLTKRFENYYLYNKKEDNESQITKIEYLKKIIKAWDDPKNKLKIPKVTIFYGNTGTGKGHLCTALIYELIKNYKADCKFVKTETYMDMLKASWKKDKEDEHESDIKRKYTSCDMLILDEIGLRDKKDTDWFFKELYMLIDTRYENGKPTILTTNLTEQELANYFNQYHKRLASRVFASDNRLFRFGWEDGRKGAGKLWR